MRRSGQVIRHLEGRTQVVLEPLERHSFRAQFWRGGELRLDRGALRRVELIIDSTSEACAPRGKGIPSTRAASCNTVMPFPSGSK